MSKACFKRLHWNPLKLDVDVTNHASQCSVSDLICQLLPIPILQQSHTFPWTLSQILKKKCCLILSNTRNYSENVVISCRELDNLQMLWQVNNLGLIVYLKLLETTVSDQHLGIWSDDVMCSAFAALKFTLWGSFLEALSTWMLMSFSFAPAA